MNNRIREKMFTTPLTIFPSSAPDSAGDIEPLEPINLTGYVMEEMQLVDTELGTKEISNMQIYLAENDIASVPDNATVTCLSKQSVRVIHKKVYRGAKNAILIGVIYLP